MSFEWRELGQTLRNDTFATWFGWSIIVSVIIFPVTATMSSCYHQASVEDIEMAKLKAEHGSQEVAHTETMKWMVSHGIHPLVARCAIFNDPYQTCAALIGDLEEKERSTITMMLANPTITNISEAIEMVISTPVRTADDYVRGLDFGSESPTR